MKNSPKLIAALIIVLLAGEALAVKPAAWKHSTEADFSKGEFDGTAVNSRGELLLVRQVDVLWPADDAPTIVSAVAVVGANIYAASGIQPIIYKVTADETVELATLPGTMIACMVAAGEDLLVGVSGDGAGIYRVDSAGQVQTVWAGDKDKVKYVWGVARARGEDILYAATGPNGRVYAIDADGQGEVIYETGKLAKNILCIAVDDDGAVYAGTDTEGLVVKIDPAAKSGRVILDAAEKEIAALILDEMGGLYVATSDAARADGKGVTPPVGRKNGKPEKAKPAPTTKPKDAAEIDAADSPSTPPVETANGDDGDKGAADAPAKNDDAEAKASNGDNAKIEEATTKPQITVAATQPASQPAEKTPAPKKAKSSKLTRILKASVKPSSSGGGGAKGNAVYYIQPDGLVRTVFRRPVTILSMVRQGDQLILGTGNGGDVYSVSTDGEQIVRLANTEARQITAVVVDSGDAIIFATANKGSVGTIAAAPVESGSFTCEVLDAKQIAAWGSVKIAAAVPPGAKVTFATRSGNVAKPDEKTWSDWSNEISIGEDFAAITSPSGRFLQYRVTLAPAGEDSPFVQDVQIMYQVGNLAPKVSSVVVTAVARDKRSKRAGAPKIMRKIKIKAKDGNGDTLMFKIEFRRIGDTQWIRIAKELRKSEFSWDTTTVGDGRYELRITASDLPANPSKIALKSVRISEAVVVDNTPPRITNLTASPTGDKAEVQALAGDASRLASIEYTVDSQQKWKTVLAEDGITDSNRERFSFSTESLESGTHRIAIRVKDIYGNAGYAAINVMINK